MGKASRWFCSLITCKKPQHQLPNDKRRWSFVKSSKHKLNRHHQQTSCEEQDYVVDPDKHAIAVAAATAAVADTAVVVAKAATVVVNLTSSGRCDLSYYRCGGGGYRERWAAVAVQSAFRGYLARKALKALKALVRLQALVRGHIARKQTAAQVRQMQALLRVQARARAGRVAISESSQSNSSTKSAYCHPGPATPEKSEEIRSRSPRRNQPSSLKRNTSRSENCPIIYQAGPRRGSNLNNHATDLKVWDPWIITCPEDDVTSGKILEVDPSGKPFNTFQGENRPFRSTHQITASDIHSHIRTTTKDSSSHQAAPSSYSCEAIFLNPKNFSRELEEASYCTADNSPHFYSASSVEYGSSKGGPFTPTKSDSLHSYISGYSDRPNYMSNTESSKAKLRSLSAPKQRLQYERLSSTKRQSHFADNESKTGSQRLSAMHASFTSKAYPGSGRLDKLGTPVTGGDSCTSLYGYS